jgi:hypothetical protein
MDATELKVRIFKEVDALDKTKLEEIYGYILNYLNSKKTLGEWEKMTKTQQQGIVEAVDEIASGKEIPHEQVISHFRKKYA